MPRTDWLRDCALPIVASFAALGICPHFSYSHLLVRHHWLVLGSVVFICVTLTIVGVAFTQLPDFSDPRIVSCRVALPLSSDAVRSR